MAPQTISIVRRTIALVCLMWAGQAHADTIDDVVTGEIQRQNIPGVAVGIFRQGEVVRMQGYGLANLELQVPVRRETVFQSGSLGKMFTAAAVVALVDDGQLALDAPVRRYLPDAPRAWRAIRVRHLLNHTAGLGQPDLDPQREYTEHALLKLHYRAPVRFKPGQRWEYSNAGYLLLGSIVGKVAGKHYGEVLQERVFGPARMATARVISESDIVPNRAAGYEVQQQGAGLKNQHWNSAALNATADGSLLLALPDYARWDAVVAQRGLFSAESWREIWRPAPLNNGSSYPYGFGWQLDVAQGEYRAIGHGGAWQGFRTDLRRYDSEGVTFVVLANSNHADVERILQGVAEAYDPRYRREGAGLLMSDDRPPLTLALRRSLDHLAAGTAKLGEFPDVPARAAPQWLKDTGSTLAEAGICRDLRLMRHRPNGDRIERRYRADCSNHALDVRVLFDLRGRPVQLWVAREEG
ncbi:serine hydrolase [Hydrogenophaga sp.]|uniref:serine hydrolase domain-containing protein n=1 Tax=Hydrogenophaga sp. TaxID=1904254 RepID=UPI00272390BF|nr:serine hydrolase domain-containing protein [Hydrogenophaga sp.]MDO9436294.1 serine hydrolase domain-containing protein [Hydrogenophaga sp.]